MEQWKDIPGYDGLYQVSNMGNIRSYHNNKFGKCEEFIYLKLNEKKYTHISLYNKNNRKTAGGFIWRFFKPN